jgi:hypothetical protein
MKKQTLYFLSCLLIATFTTSCDDFLEVEPTTQKSEANSYKSETDAMEAMVAVYDALAVQPWTFVPLQSDIFSDDLYCGGEPGGGMGQWQEQEQSIISLENAAARDLWNKSYSGIYRANTYLYKESGINWQDADRRARMAAEVKVLRAYFYWDLVRHYGSVPIIPEGYNAPTTFRSLPQRSPEELYTYIAKDLLGAITDLPLTVPASEKGRITKDVARVLIGRIFLYYQGFVRPVMGVVDDWSDGETTIDKPFVRTMIDEIITSNRYELLANYADVFAWNNENNEESVFEWQYSEKALSNDWGGWGIDGNFSVVFFGPRSPQGDPSIAPGWSFGVVTWSLYNEFEAGDVRRDITIYNANTNLTSYQKGFQNTGYFNKKYMPLNAYRPAQGTTDHNWPINYKDMRFAEVLLMGAELFLDTDMSKAADYLSDVRERAMGVDARKETITLDDIYHERRVELGGEGHRKWDLLRRGLDYAKTRIDATWDVGEVENKVDFQNREFKTLTWGMLPIPASEIRLMDKGVLNQFVPAFQ